MRLVTLISKRQVLSTVVNRSEMYIHDINILRAI